MTTGRKILLCLIVIFGGVIAYLSYQFLGSTKTIMYVFANNYEAGTKITRNMFEEVEVDESIVTNLNYKNQNNGKPCFVTKASLDTIINKGEYLGVDVYQGTPFMTTETASYSVSTVERRLSDYKTAITIPVNNLSGVSPEIQAGARINIYASYSTESYEVVQLLFQNVKILDVQSTGDSSAGYTLTGFTIEVDPNDAMKLLHAINNWDIDITLLKSGAYDVMTSSSIYKVNTLMLDAIIGSSSNYSVSQGTSTGSSISNVSNSSNINEVTGANTTNQPNNTTSSTVTSTTNNTTGTN